MGDGPLKISHPLLNKQTSWCSQLADKELCRTLSLGTESEYIPTTALVRPKFSTFITSITARPRPKGPHWGWKLAIQFAKLVQAADIEIKGLAMNGRRKGCHRREAHPKGLRREGCNTHYKKGTETDAKLEFRQVAGKNICRAYRFYVNYTKPLIHKFKGIIPVTTYGFYGNVGPSSFAMGPMCDKINLMPFGSHNCGAYQKRFYIPLTGKIPQNWAKKYGRLTYALDYPFAFTKTFTKGFLGVWGMVDRKFYKRVGIPYMTFPTRIDHVVELLSTIDVKRATHINLNKPYNYKTGPWPHIEWLDLHNAKATIILKDGTINVPGIGKIVFDKGKYLKEENLDRHPKLLAIAKEWRKYRNQDPTKAKQLAIEYYRERKRIKNTANRIDIRATKKNITITIHNPAINEITLPLGRAKIKAEGLSIGSITIVMPSVYDLRYKRKKMADTNVLVEGLSAKKLTVIDQKSGLSIDLNDGRLGKIALKDGRFSVVDVSTKSWAVKRLQNGLNIKSGFTSIGSISAVLKGTNRGVEIKAIENDGIRIASKLFALMVDKSKIKTIRLGFNSVAKKLSIKGISTDLKAGRIGSIQFGKINIGAGKIGHCTLNEGTVSVLQKNGTLQADIYGLINVVVNKTEGSQLSLNVPGLDISGILQKIFIKGPAHFVLKRNSWELNHKPNGSHSTKKLSVKAQLTKGTIKHDPGVRDAKLRTSRYRKLFTTALKFNRADFAIGDIQKISFEIGGNGSSRKSQFSHLEIKNASLTNIVGSGPAWVKMPPWHYLGAKFNRLIGSISLGSVEVKSNAQQKSSEFKDVILDLKETKGDKHKCYIKLPLLKFSPNKYFIGDPSGKPLKFNCGIYAWLRGGYFQFISKKRPLKYRRPYK